MRLLTTIFAAFLLGLACPAAAQTFPERNRAAVVDVARAIPDDAEVELDAAIVAWNRETGHQFAVATVPSLQGLAIQDYANGLFRRWRLGREGVNDGVLLLLAPNERVVRIEVGYGLEGELTDALTSAIIRDTIRPGLRSGDIAGALSGGAKQIMAAASADPAPAAWAGKAALVSSGAPPVADPPFPWGFFLFLIAAIFGPIILIFRARRKRRLARGRDERRYATVTRRGEPYVATSDGGAALAASSARAASSDYYSSSWSSGSESSSSWDSSSSSSSSDSGFDSGGGSSGGGGSDSSY